MWKKHSELTETFFSYQISITFHLFNFFFGFFPKGASMERARPRLRMANQTEPSLPRWKRCTLPFLSGCQKPTCMCRGCTRTGWRAWTPRRSRTLCTPPTVQWIKARAAWTSNGNHCRAVLGGCRAALEASVRLAQWGSAQLGLVLGRSIALQNQTRLQKPWFLPLSLNFYCLSFPAYSGFLHSKAWSCKVHKPFLPGTRSGIPDQVTPWSEGSLHEMGSSKRVRWFYF